ncbi:MAG: peptidyl-prolyl cis-trans isomerase [Verrucomicrobiia bacterium]
MKLCQKCWIVLGCLLGAAPLVAQNTDGIAAVVNGKVITFSEVKRQVQDAEQALSDSGLQGGELMDRVKEIRLEALRALIERELIIQEFNSKGYFLPDNVVEDQVYDIVRTKFDGDRVAFIKTLKAMGKTLDQFKQDQRDSLVVRIMRQKFVSEEVIVSPFKIEEYYFENASKFATPDQVRLSMIFFKRTSPPENSDTNASEISKPSDPQYDLALETLLKLEAGENFADLASTYSEGPASADGGDLGWVSRDTLRKELADIAFKLNPEQNSQVIETDDGYYILKVEERKRAGIKPIEDARSEIESQLLVEERRKTQEQWLNRLRSKAYIKMF